MARQSLLMAVMAGSAAAVRLYVSTYAGVNQTLGAVTTFELNLGLGEGKHANAASLKTIATNNECGSEPTWLDKHPNDGNIYCLDEGWLTPNASLNTLQKNADGSLKRISTVDTIQGPVSTQFYNNNTAVAIAHYGGSAISTFKRSADGKLTALQNFEFFGVVGPRPEQEASHIHEALIDPTGKFLIFPDLGADLVRVYAIDATTGLLTVQEPIKSPSAYGPRHAAFWSPKGSSYTAATPTYLFVIHELGNRVISYQVSYNASTIGFTKIQEVGLYGNQSDPAGTRASEIAVSPDGQFVTASNRNATIFSVANPDPKISAKLPSDSFTVFKPSADGKLTFIQNAPTGGSFPRHFSYNKDGTLVAVGNQNSQSVEIWARDVATGKIGDRVASATGLPGNTTYVLWDE